MWLNISELLDKTLQNIRKVNENEELIFELDNGTSYRMWHSQDCCESVLIEDICGDLEDLIGSPIVQAEESTSDSSKPWPKELQRPEYLDDSWTWTFYKLATNKGSVTIRWFGESNGYYSERVDFAKIED